MESLAGPGNGLRWRRGGERETMLCSNDECDEEHEKRRLCAYVLCVLKERFC